MLAVVLSWPTTLMGQGERGSLTDQFPNLSAKERARIASKEAEESAKDASYQNLMRDSEKAFQEGRYEDALRGYEQARILRPYNVYPKVKIEDLNALLKRKAAEEHATEQATTEAVPEQKMNSTVTTPDLPESGRKETADPVKEEPRPAKIADAPSDTTTPVKAEPERANKRTEGLIERRYREGHAYVIERAVQLDGRVVIYKRVYHNYGQVFYFEDGLAVDERVWKQRFPDE